MSVEYTALHSQTPDIFYKCQTVSRAVHVKIVISYNFFVSSISRMAACPSRLFEYPDGCLQSPQGY